MYDIHNLNNQQLEFLKNYIDSAKNVYIMDNCLFMEFGSLALGQGTVTVKLDPVHNVYLSNAFRKNSSHMTFGSDSKTSTLASALKITLIRLRPVQAISSEAEMQSKRV